MSANPYLTDDLDITAAYIARQDINASVSAAKLAHNVLDEILAFLKPGIRESEVKAFTFDLYKKYNFEKPWHMPYIRFGEHTLLTFYDKGKEDLVLQDTDIAFADIGIVKDGIEGDAGRTIAFGTNGLFHQLVEASQKIFAETAAYWKQHNPSGQELYAVAHDITQAYGLTFNLKSAGHLIGTYPHQGWMKGLNDFPDKAANGTWVLEIQIRHPELPYGAFFEDILI